MKANIYFGRFGASFWCSDCNQQLEDSGSTLAHPKERGTIFIKASTCQFSGQTAKNPFQDVELLPHIPKTKP